MLDGSWMVLFPCGNISWTVLSCLVLDSHSGSLLLESGSFVLLGVNATLLVPTPSRCDSFQDPFAFVIEIGPCSRRLQ